MNDKENINIILADIKELVKYTMNYAHGIRGKREYRKLMIYVMDDIEEAINRLDFNDCDKA